MLLLVLIKANPWGVPLLLSKSCILLILLQPLSGREVFSVRNSLYLIALPTCGDDIHPAL